MTIMTSYGNKKSLLVYFFIFFLITEISQSVENKIILKIENNISQSEEFVENLIITFSEQSHKLGLPMALAVCIPNLQFKK